MVQFAIDPGRTALVIVDMQNCFVAGSALAVPAGEQDAGRLSRRAAACRGARIPVAWTRHAVRPGGGNTGLLRQLVPPAAAGVINNDAPTAALHPLMDLRPGDIVVGKPRFGSFYGTGLAVILRPRGIDTLIVGGINTNVRVDTTAREAAVREFRVVFLSDGTANFDLPDSGLSPGQRGRAAARRVRRDGVRLRPDPHRWPDAGPDRVAPTAPAASSPQSSPCRYRSNDENRHPQPSDERRVP